MMTKAEVENFDIPCQYIEGKKIPCVVVQSHLEAIKEIEGLQKETRVYQKALWLLADEIEKRVGVEMFYGEGSTETDIVCDMVRNAKIVADDKKEE